MKFRFVVRMTGVGRTPTVEVDSEEEAAERVNFAEINLADVDFDFDVVGVETIEE